MMRLIGLMLLLVGVNTFADNHLLPVVAIENYFSSFNKEDRDGLNEAADSPFIFVIGGEPRSYDRYGDAVDFEGLKASGWSYSLINSKELIYSDDLTAAVRMNFSRFNESDEVISTTDSVYLLVRRDGEWKVKGGFLNGTLTLGK
jgi:hypothetical protein|tara:strand:- start:42 stop:476 length:435 start_codon:yes stop_codon:yes gene_type:complete